jgi:hypothetical protein
MRLEDVLPAATVDAIRASGKLVFHAVGDTGGIKDWRPQAGVTAGMEADFSGSQTRPSFLFHLGDVVYFNGESARYYDQFYEPYMRFPAPIFAIPGNHDGDPIDATIEPSLAAFVSNFCSPTARMTPEAQEVQRAAMTQPNVYWTLVAPFVTVVGLYTNVPEGGQVGDEQVRWLTDELRAADPEAGLIIALHHPAYSADSVHGGGAAMAEVLDTAMQEAGRLPTAVFTAHVHNYQRFSRRSNGRNLPYIVAGAGGYHTLHRIAKDADGNSLTPGWQPPDHPGVTLENFCDDQYGFMRVTASPGRLAVDYVVVGSPRDVPHTAPSVFESWSISWGP